MLRKFNIAINGKEYYVEMEELGTAPGTVVAAPVVAAPVVPVVDTPVAASAPVTPASNAAQKAPIPGKILDVKVNVGDKVEKDQVLLILEAMKMENSIVALKSGTVAAVHVAVGANVNAGDALITVE